VQTLYSVTPVEKPFSGTTDSTGAFTFQGIIRQAYWTLVKVVASCPGTGVWSILLTGTQIPLDFAVGPRLSVGPFIIAPEQSITVQLVNATPNSIVSGNLWGKQYPDQQSAALDMVIAPNPLTVATQSSRGLGQFTFGQGAQTTQNVKIPSDTQYLLLIPFPNRVGYTQIMVSGHVTGATYLPSQSPSLLQQTGTNPFSVGPIDSSDDTSVDIQVTAIAGGILDNFSLYVVALFNPPTPIPGELAASQLVPASWQAPNKSPAYLEGSNTAVNGATLVTGVAGQTIRVFGWQIEQEGGAAFVALRDSSIAAPNGRFATNNAVGSATGGGSGSPLTTGAGVIIDSVAGATTARIVLYYSIF
jgi:hypothetical protein